MLGSREGTRVEPADQISAHANRVPVENGHTVCMSVDFGTHVSADAALEVLRALAWRRGARATSELPRRHSS